MATDPLSVRDPEVDGVTARGAARTFVVLSTTDYDAPQFGSRQQIAHRLAARGHRVLFVEVPRALHSFWTDSDAARVALRRSGRLREAAPRLLAFTPSFVLVEDRDALLPATEELHQLVLRRVFREDDQDPFHVPNQDGLKFSSSREQGRPRYHAGGARGDD